MLFVLSVAIYAPLVIISGVLPVRVALALVRGWTRYVKFILAVVCDLHYRVDGLEHIPQQSFIVLSKHQSAWETLMFHLIFPNPVYVLKRELLWVPFFGWALWQTRPIAIDRSRKIQALTQILEQGDARLKNNRTVVVFPEGTRMRPGETRSYGLSGAALAAHTGCPVLPVAHNAGLFWAKRGFIKRPGVVNVVIGPAIAAQNKAARQINEEAASWINRTMLNLEGSGLSN